MTSSWLFTYSYSFLGINHVVYSQRALRPTSYVVIINYKNFFEPLKNFLVSSIELYGGSDEMDSSGREYALINTM